MRMGRKAFTIIVSAAEMEHVTAIIARLAQKRHFFALSGDLGAGKTHLARAFIRQLTHDQMEVPSPTFTLVQYYRGRIEKDDIDICHADFYRLDSPEEIEELGVREFEGITLVEWPEKMGTFLPHDAIKIHLREIEDASKREMKIDAPSDWLDHLRKALGEADE